MSEMIPGNQKHLTKEDRLYIERALNEGTSFKDIAKFLCKDPTTISKEVKKRRASDWNHVSSFVNDRNFCIHRFRCRKTNVCEKLFICDRRCASCSKCNTFCKYFEKEQCSRLDRAPYVCNGCPKAVNKCPISHKYIYDALFADRKYRENLSSSRQGINMTKQELHEKDALVSPLINQGQTPYQIVTNHPELDMSVRSVYNYISDGLFTARDVDLKRKVKFRKRRCHKTQITDRSVFVNRTYDCFCRLDQDSIEHCVEMDTVHSARPSRKVILTFFFRSEKLFLAFLLNRCTKGAVKEVFNRLEKRLGTYDFLTLFNTILTDRGSEFADPVSLETGINDIQRTSIYFCDPMRSGQKGGVENVHTMLRNVLPKGSSFEYLTQWDVNLIVNHINSTPRASLNGRTPYEAALERFGVDVLKELQLRPIDPDDVNLTPKLIK